MQKNTNPRKLALKTTTIRTLDAEKLEPVQGGRPKATKVQSCIEQCDI
jgi:hypothetical protein